MAENQSECGPGCNCGKPSGSKKLKITICIIVLLAVSSIFAYKTKNGKQTAPVNTATAFAVPIVKEVNEQNSVASIIDKRESTIKAVEENKKVGEFLDSLSALDKVAINQDSVFVFIPAKGNETISKEIMAAITSAEQKIKSKGASLGLYTMQSSSPEYANIAAQLPPPSILVMSKGRGMGAVSGGITEEKILQAYVASSQAGGCGPSGCGPSSSGCAPTAPIGPVRTR
ncbi:MAG: hypothetical protein A2Y10_06945 [Planctomycetes bacterium GWF2_41_51]|nr:MAG: hypothetical protein A2Y10_06945 [Planctomycetes bacterium GWF2_41_51]HBG28799.1 hypothetical protein [Phycisphaerales bacterium]